MGGIRVYDTLCRKGRPSAMQTFEQGLGLCGSVALRQVISCAIDDKFAKTHLSAASPCRPTLKIIENYGRMAHL